MRIHPSCFTSLSFCWMPPYFSSYLVKTLTGRTSGAASEKDKNDRIGVFKMRGSTLRGINGNVSSTVKTFKVIVNIQSLLLILCKWLANKQSKKSKGG